MPRPRSTLSWSCAPAIACSLVLVAGLGLGAGPASAADDASHAVAAKAVDWLVTQQQADGGFEVAGFPGFETPDAVLALAEQAQTAATWDAGVALARVQSVTKNGKSALDELDDFADGAFGALKAGQAAKLIVLVTAPLGLDPTAFDPQGDGATNLVATMDAGVLPDGSYGVGALNATLYAVLAQRLLGRSIAASTVAFVRAAQQANGGWDFSGDPSSTSDDVDTTALAIEALAAAGAPSTDGAIVKGLAFLGAAQNADGSWNSFGSPDPNSTSSAELAVVAAGLDPSTSCWRDTLVPDKLGTPYTAPDVFLRAQQAADGHVASPNDGFGVNTFPTSQVVQALLHGWLPVGRAASAPCDPPTATTSTTTGTTATTATTASTTTTLSAPAAVATNTPASVVVAGAQATVTATPSNLTGTLPRTGDSTGPLAAAGVGLLAVGLVLSFGARRKVRPS